MIKDGLEMKIKYNRRYCRFGKHKVKNEKIAFEIKTMNRFNGRLGIAKERFSGMENRSEVIRR